VKSLFSKYVVSFLIPLVFISIVHASEEFKDNGLNSIITLLLLPDDSPQVKIVEGPAQVIEAEFHNVSRDYNNSTSTPLARHGDYVYWVYIGNDDPEKDYKESPTPPNHFVQIHQITLPEQRGDGPYSVVSKEFINNFGEADHQLRVLDGTNGAPNDLNHTAPSVGVDDEGYIHVMGGMHHSRWEYCISTKPNDISEWECPTEGEGEGESDATYPRFFKHPNGTLYLTNRGRFDSHWFNGTSNASLAVYSKQSGWTALGDDNYTLGDLLLQKSQIVTPNEETGRFELPVDPKWVEGVNLPNTRHGLFYSASAGYHRYFRHPKDGRWLAEYATTAYAYQAFWTDMKIDFNNRIHVATAVRNSPSYDPEEFGAEPGSIRVSPQSYQYDEESYVINYDHGSSILYAYSDDGGDTFYAPNGERIDTPISPEPLTSLDGSDLRSATVENGAIAYQDNSSTIHTGLDSRVELSLLSDGTPIIFFRENVSGASDDYFLSGLQWNGEAWERVAADNRLHGAAGGLISDAAGGMWAFESSNADKDVIPSKPSSAGDTVLYSNTGIDGPWVELTSSWKNGMRVDSFTANTSNVMRYVEMDIQRGGTARIISLIPPENVTE